MERVKSGILGLDQVIEGGFPRGSSILVTGPAGSAKTILGLQFLYEGARKFGEAGILVQAEEFDKTIEWYTEEFNFDLAKMQDLGLLAIFGFHPKDYGKFMPHTLEGEILRKLDAIITNLGVKRVVVDSITPISLAVKDISDYRYSLYEFIKFMKDRDITTLLVAEEKTREETKFAVEDHLVDGIIKTRKVELEDSSYGIELKVSKMVATNFPERWFPVMVGRRGVSIKPF